MSSPFFTLTDELSAMVQNNRNRSGLRGPTCRLEKTGIGHLPTMTVRLLSKRLSL
ncbi:MAG: hypothetical protein ACKVG6_09960 [Alphaproteobacteria bacterium]